MGAGGCEAGSTFSHQQLFFDRPDWTVALQPPEPNEGLSFIQYWVNAQAAALGLPAGHFSTESFLTHPFFTAHHEVCDPHNICLGDGLALRLNETEDVLIGITFTPAQCGLIFIVHYDYDWEKSNERIEFLEATDIDLIELDGQGRVVRTFCCSRPEFPKEAALFLDRQSQEYQGYDDGALDPELADYIRQMATKKHQGFELDIAQTLSGLI